MYWQMWCVPGPWVMDKWVKDIVYGVLWYEWCLGVPGVAERLSRALLGSNGER